MALVLNDRVKETSTTTGTGAVTLGGAVTGFDTFSTGVGNSNTTYYAIVNRTVDEWEVGLGTLAADSSTLTRTTVLTNSDGNTSAITLSAGTKEVFCTEPASKTMDMTLTTAGDTVYASAANTPARLAVGTARYTLQTNSGGTLPEWAASPQSVLTGTGDILYSSSANTLARLAAGTGTYNLAMNSGGTAPEWVEAFSGISWQSVQTSSPITGVAGNGYPINTTSGAITINLPAGVVGEQIAVVDYAGTFDSNALTIAANGSEKIKGATDDATMETERQAGVLTYVDATQGWVLTSAAPDPGLTQPTWMTATGGTITENGDYKVHTFTGDGTFEVTALGTGGGSTTIDYLVVAGGAGGGYDMGGGGGAGGYRVNYPNPITGGTPVSVTTYPIVVGAGGTKGAPPGTTPAGAGGTSSGFSVSSAGGGGAGKLVQAGIAGGSGGGGGGVNSAAGPFAGGAGNTPPAPVSQGNAGGTSLGGTPYSPNPSYPAGNMFDGSGGGGGGSGGVGQDGGPTYAPSPAVAPPTRATGGAATTITIPGSPTAYAGGGGGGGYPGPPINPRPGGTATGGGGAGGGPAGTPGSDGSNNTGGGAGGGTGAGGSGGVGGSGVVIATYKFQ